MDFQDAKTMVDKMLRQRVTEEQSAAIVQHMVENGCSVLHACWELFGKARGKQCHCTPCTEAVLFGEVNIRVLVSCEVLS